MYQCSSCGGNLKFDIVRQQLSCEHCGTKADPYSFYKEKDAEERAGEYEVTVFACPQCGSELMSEDTTVATFCSFCGASTILDRRIRRERRPEYILPFTKTKEDCRAAYGRMLRRAVFAPKELKDETLIEKFRGIYMPYWVYSFEKNEGIGFPGSKTCRSGDYLITDHYELKSQVEANYEGLSYDASSTFADSLSDAIAPFDLRQKKDFAPSFLSGFYADTNDVEDYVYMQEAEDFVLKDACRCLAREPVCRRHGAERGGRESQLWNALRPSGRKAELAMLPVWFLSYRNGDRVSYAVVNGQTGKAAADLPQEGKIIAIDGRCASGKTTLAKRLMRVTGAGAVHMDDFFLPPKLRRPERLEEPGGNVHYERFMEEVLTRIKDPREFRYRCFDCGTMRPGAERTVKEGRLRIVEGAYSCHPVFGDYMGLRVFCHVEPQEQLRRIEERNGAEMLNNFRNRWIPMEERYIRHCRIREQAHLVVS